MLLEVASRCEEVLELVLECLEVVDVDGVEDDAYDEDAKESEGEGDTIDDPGQHDDNYGSLDLSRLLLAHRNSLQNIFHQWR